MSARKRVSSPDVDRPKRQRQDLPTLTNQTLRLTQQHVQSYKNAWKSDPSSILDHPMRPLTAMFQVPSHSTIMDSATAFSPTKLQQFSPKHASQIVHIEPHPSNQDNSPFFIAHFSSISTFNSAIHDPASPFRRSNQAIARDGWLANEHVERVLLLNVPQVHLSQDEYGHQLSVHVLRTTGATVKNIKFPRGTVRNKFHAIMTISQPVTTNLLDQLQSQHFHNTTLLAGGTSNPHLYRCTQCNSLGHKSNSCPNADQISITIHCHRSIFPYQLQPIKEALHADRICKGLPHAHSSTVPNSLTLTYKNQQTYINTFKNPDKALQILAHHRVTHVYKLHRESLCVHCHHPPTSASYTCPQHRHKIDPPATDVPNQQKNQPQHQPSTTIPQTVQQNPQNPQNPQPKKELPNPSPDKHTTPPKSKPNAKNQAKKQPKKDQTLASQPKPQPKQPIPQPTPSSKNQPPPQHPDKVTTNTTKTKPPPKKVKNQPTTHNSNHSTYNPAPLKLKSKPTNTSTNSTSKDPSPQVFKADLSPSPEPPPSKPPSPKPPDPAAQSEPQPTKTTIAKGIISYSNLLTPSTLAALQTLAENPPCELQPHGKNHLMGFLANPKHGLALMYSWGNNTLISKTWLQELDEALEEAQTHISTPLPPFNSCLINVFRDGNDCSPKHWDKKQGSDDPDHVLLICLGATRPFEFSHKKTRKVTTINLHHGDVVVIDPDGNTTHRHERPKILNVHDSSYSLSFRVVPPPNVLS